MIASGWLPSLPCSLEQLDRRQWLDRGDGLLVNELRLPISREQNAEAVERSHVALELDPTFEKHYHRDLMILKVSEEHLLNSLGPLYCHAEIPSMNLVTSETLHASLQIIVLAQRLTVLLTATAEGSR